MELIEKTLLAIWQIVLFMVISIVFLPAWLIVTYLQEPWSKQFDNLFS